VGRILHARGKFYAAMTLRAALYVHDRNATKAPDMMIYYASSQARQMQSSGSTLFLIKRIHNENNDKKD
jgi:hypothetical protein